MSGICVVFSNLSEKRISKSMQRDIIDWDVTFLWKKILFQCQLTPNLALKLCDLYHFLG